MEVTDLVAAGIGARVIWTLPGKDDWEMEVLGNCAGFGRPDRVMLKRAGTTGQGIYTANVADLHLPTAEPSTEEQDHYDGAGTERQSATGSAAQWPAYQWTASDDWDDSLEVSVFRFPDREQAERFYDLCPYGEKTLRGRVAEVEVTHLRGGADVADDQPVMAPCGEDIGAYADAPLAQWPTERLIDLAVQIVRGRVPQVAEPATALQDIADALADQGESPVADRIREDAARLAAERLNATWPSDTFPVGSRVRHTIYRESVGTVERADTQLRGTSVVRWDGLKGSQGLITRTADLEPEETDYLQSVAIVIRLEVPAAYGAQSLGDLRDDIQRAVEGALLKPSERIAGADWERIGTEQERP